MVKHIHVTIECSDSFKSGHSVARTSFGPFLPHDRPEIKMNAVHSSFMVCMHLDTLYPIIFLLSYHSYSQILWDDRMVPDGWGLHIKYNKGAV